MRRAIEDEEYVKWMFKPGEYYKDQKANPAQPNQALL